MGSFTEANRILLDGIKSNLVAVTIIEHAGTIDGSVGKPAGFAVGGTKERFRHALIIDLYDRAVAMKKSVVDTGVVDRIGYCVDQIIHIREN